MMKKNKIYVTFFWLLLCCTFQLSYGQGARYTGSYGKSSSIKQVSKSNFVIEGLEIMSTNEDCIALYSCENVIIRNCKLGPSPVKKGIYLYNCKNITIIDCTFENIQSGLVASTSQGIKFEYNDLTNIVGPIKGGDKIGVMVQFIQVSGANNSISYNVCENIFGQSEPEDLINLNQSNGTAQSPIMVKGNWIRGGGPSSSGGGINLGDMGGSYQIAEDNILVDVGQYAMGISGGHDMTLRNNKIYGQKKYFTNVGITVCNWYENLGKSYNITVANNSVNFTHKDGYLNNWWYASNVETVSGKATNVYKSDLQASILPEKIIGRARDPAAPPIVDPTTNPITDPVSESNEETTDPSINIYKDKFNRICVNCKGVTASSAKITVSNQAGQKIVIQSIAGYHTVIENAFSPGIYYVSVENGDKKHNKQIIIE